jgi:hypothetical protein
MDDVAPLVARLVTVGERIAGATIRLRLASGVVSELANIETRQISLALKLDDILAPQMASKTSPSPAQAHRPCGSSAGRTTRAAPGLWRRIEQSGISRGRA